MARVAAGGKVVVCDVVELNREFDVDTRTARAAVHPAHRIASGRS
ncbi:hypothetical protein ACOKM5_40485 [Streptomyces sp. BH097]